MVREAMQQTGAPIKLGGEIYADGSPEGEGRPENADIETHNPNVADRVDRGLRNAADIDTLIPELVRQTMCDTTPAIMTQFSKMLDPLYQEVSTIQAMVQGGTRAEQQVQQLTGVLAAMLKKMNTLEDELGTLRKLRRCAALN